MASTVTYVLSWLHSGGREGAGRGGTGRVEHVADQLLRPREYRLHRLARDLPSFNIGLSRRP